MEARDPEHTSNLDAVVDEFDPLDPVRSKKSKAADVVDNMSKLQPSTEPSDLSNYKTTDQSSRPSILNPGASNATSQQSSINIEAVQRNSPTEDAAMAISTPDSTPPKASEDSDSISKLRPIKHGTPKRGILKPPPPPTKSLFKRDWFQSLNSKAILPPATTTTKSTEQQTPHVTPSATSTSTSILTSAFRRLNATSSAPRLNTTSYHTRAFTDHRTDPFASEPPSPASPDRLDLAPSTKQRPGIPFRNPPQIDIPQNNPLPNVKQDLLSPDSLKRVRFSIGQLTTEYAISSSLYTHQNAPPPLLSPGVSPYRRSDDLLSPPLASDRPRKRKRLGPRQVLNLYLKSCQMREEFPLDRVVAVLRDASSTNGKPISTLDLTSEQLDIKNVDPLSDILTIDFGLQRLILAGCDLVDDTLKPLLHALLIGDCVPWLNLEGNRRIKQVGWKYIAVLVGRSSALKYLDLSNTSFDRKAAEYLVQALTASNNGGESKLFIPDVALRTLKLDKCGLKVSVLEVLGPGIRRSHLQHLSLRNNRINHQGAVWVGVLMKDYEEDTPATTDILINGDPPHVKKEVGLESIDVRGNEIRTGVQYIASALRRNSTLRVLQLSDNKIDVKGLVQIAEALKHNTTLEILDLSKNPCCGPGVEGVASLRTSFTSNRNLKKLFLSDTQLSSEGAIALAEFLPETKGLEHLDLTANYDLSIAGILALSVAVKMNTSLRCLDVNIPPNDVEMSRLSRDILQACIRNTEVAQRDALANGVVEPIPSPILSSAIAKAAAQPTRDQHGIDWEGVKKVCDDGRRGVKVVTARLDKDSGTTLQRIPADEELREWHARLSATLKRLVMLIEVATDEAILGMLLELNDQLPPLLERFSNTYSLDETEVAALGLKAHEQDRVAVSPTFSLADSDDSDEEISDDKDTPMHDLAIDVPKGRMESPASSQVSISPRSPIEDLRKGLEEEEGEVLRRGRLLLEEEEGGKSAPTEELKDKILDIPIEREEHVEEEISL